MKPQVCTSLHSSWVSFKLNGFVQVSPYDASVSLHLWFTWTTLLYALSAV